MSTETEVRVTEPQAPAILLVEDNAADVLLLRHALRNARIVNPLFEVRDGQEAIQYLSGDAPYADRARFPLPALVLLDLRLPRLSGFEVLAWIREQPELGGTIVVVLTASDHVPDATKAHELGANSYLVKPSTFEDLVALVEGIAGRWLLQKAAPSRGPSREGLRAGKSAAARDARRVESRSVRDSGMQGQVQRPAAPV